MKSFPRTKPTSPAASTRELSAKLAAAKHRASAATAKLKKARKEAKVLKKQPATAKAALVQLSKAATARAAAKARAAAARRVKLATRKVAVSPMPGRREASVSARLAAERGGRFRLSAGGVRAGGQRMSPSHLARFRHTTATGS